MRPVRRLLGSAVVLALTLGGLGAVAGPAAASEEVYPAPASGSWTVDGRAWGHGRGMSQWGAQGAALQGVSADAILAFYYPGTTSTSISGQYVNVSLSAFAPATTVTIWSPENRPIRMGLINGEVVVGPGRWTITVADGTVTAQRRDTPGGAITETQTYAGTLRMESQQEYGMVIAANESATTGRWYRGDLRIVPTTGTGFNVTNSLPMEDYLRSVVPRESPASWAAAALQAQAVAARTYAWYKVVHGSTLCDTTSCQVYYGKGVADVGGTLTTSYEDPRSDAAITATAGRVLLYGGAVAFTEFSSSNGGWTTAGSPPYQVAKYDPWSGTAPGDTKTRWTGTLSVARVEASCPGTDGKLRNLVVVSRTGDGELGGRVLQARVECTTGNATVSSPAFGLLSNWWKPRSTTTTLNAPAVSASVIDHGAQMSIAATASVAMTWTLTVRDHSTGRTALVRSGEVLGGERFNATWFGTYSPVPAGLSPYVGPGTYDLTLSGLDGAGVAAPPFSTTVTVRRPADPPVVAAVPLVANGGYVPVSPTRLVDTRTTFQSLGAGQRADLAVLGAAGVPSSGVTAVVLNITAVGATTVSHLRAWPAGSPMPNASVLNMSAGRTAASLVTVGIGGEGKISLFNAAGNTHYLVDVLGYYTTNLASSSRYNAVSPVRALDTRVGQPLSSGSPVTVDVEGLLGTAAGAVSAVTVNVTTTRAQGVGYVVAYGAGVLPSTSTVNLVPGADVANRAVVPVVDGAITLALAGAPSHVVVDVVGWYAQPGVTSGAVFTPILPARLLDTRSAAPLGPAETRTVKVTGGAVPAGATAVVGTLTAVDQTAAVTHARIWPAGESLTPTSDVNSGWGRTQANAVVVRVGTGGSVQVYNDQGSSDLILDVVGFFS